MTTLSDTLKQANADLRNILAERQAMQAQLGAYALREKLNEARIARLESDNALLRKRVNALEYGIAACLDSMLAEHSNGLPITRGTHREEMDWANAVENARELLVNRAALSTTNT